MKKAIKWSRDEPPSPQPWYKKKVMDILRDRDIFCS